MWDGSRSLYSTFFAPKQIEMTGIAVAFARFAASKFRAASAGCNTE
jgi:hypothetical protein